MDRNKDNVQQDINKGQEQKKSNLPFGDVIEKNPHKGDMHGYETEQFHTQWNDPEYKEEEKKWRRDGMGQELL